MFQNTNKEVLKELAKDNYTSHKSRNRIAILAIALTTLPVSYTHLTLPTILLV